MLALSLAATGTCTYVRVTWRARYGGDCTHRGAHGVEGTAWWLACRYLRAFYEHESFLPRGGWLRRQAIRDWGAGTREPSTDCSSTLEKNAVRTQRLLPAPSNACVFGLAKTGSCATRRRFLQQRMGRCKYDIASLPSSSISLFSSASSPHVHSFAGTHRTPSHCQLFITRSIASCRSLRDPVPPS